MPTRRVDDGERVLSGRASQSTSAAAKPTSHPPEEANATGAPARRLAAEADATAAPTRRLAAEAAIETDRANRLTALAGTVADCVRCDRLVAWRTEVAATKRAAYVNDTYWGRGVPGFGDPAASVLLVGLAPAAHGANRTGRMFTGDRSGDFLYAALHRCGFANQPNATTRDDGMELRGAYVTAAVRCAPPANKPTTAERDNCRDYLETELALLSNVKVAVALGGFSFGVMCGLLGVKPRPRFGHGAIARVGGGGAGKSGAQAQHGRDRPKAVAPATAADNGAPDVEPSNSARGAPWGIRHLLGCYHPSQQNTFTGKLTDSMVDDVLRLARKLADQTG